LQAEQLVLLTQFVQFAEQEAQSPAGFTVALTDVFKYVAAGQALTH